ncbi:MAG: four helix bundle protein [Bacteroidetes bacterium]|jgi:four helix bundle protein|nr:four helix bundle protein [Bacteroidota bacterium]
MDAQFRFQDLEVWKLAIDLTDRLYDIADGLEERHFFRFAEQLRAAALSVSNNISDGSGCVSQKEFARFLDISRRSLIECANMAIILARRKLLAESTKGRLLDDLEQLSRMIRSLQYSLLR